MALFSNEATQLAYNHIFKSGYWTRDLDKVKSTSDLIELYSSMVPDAEIPYFNEIKFDEILEIMGGK